jgi:hypothetical protein
MREDGSPTNQKCNNGASDRKGRGPGVRLTVARFSLDGLGTGSYGDGVGDGVVRVRFPGSVGDWVVVLEGSMVGAGVLLDPIAKVTRLPWTSAS